MSVMAVGARDTGVGPKCRWRQVAGRSFRKIYCQGPLHNNCKQKFGTKVTKTGVTLGTETNEQQ